MMFLSRQITPEEALAQQRVLYAELCKNPIVPYTDHFRHFDTICAHPYIEKLSINLEAHFLVAQTTPVTLEVSPGLPLELGSYVLCIKRSNHEKSLHIFRVENHIPYLLDDVHEHPHVNEEGKICVGEGNMREAILGICKGNLIPAIEFGLLALHSFDNNPFRAKDYWQKLALQQTQARKEGRHA